jgi:hypothetical protein
MQFKIARKEIWINLESEQGGTVDVDVRPHTRRRGSA